MTDALYDAGYPSNSSAYTQAARQFGMTPATYRDGGAAAIAYTVTESPLGWLLVAGTTKGLCAVRLGDSPAALEAELASEFPAAAVTRDDARLGAPVNALMGYLHGAQPHLDLPLDIRATAFQQQVWRALQTIPAGSTRSYGEVAAAIGRPTAARAVARACATNPVALVIPCHRVIREDGALGGYRWGLERKQRLLAQEANAAAGSDSSAPRGNAMKAPDLARLLLLAALWGGSFIFIRIAAPVLGPIVLVTIRVLLAGAALLVYALVTRSELELRARWRQYLTIGALNSAIPFVLISTAELQLPASLAAILNATSPLFGAVIAAIWIKDPLTRKKIVGLALGLMGVSVLVGWSPTKLTPVVLLAVGASLLGAAFYGLASVYTKAKVVGAQPIGMATGSQLAAGLLLLPFVPFSIPHGQPSITVVLCVLALALFCTALAYLLYFRLIVDVGPAKALTVTFLVPIFGTLWGALFLGEQVTLSTLLGCGVVLAGTALVTGVRLGTRRRNAPASVG